MKTPNPTSKFDKLTEREKDEICALYKRNITMLKGGLETTARMYSDKRGLTSKQDRIQGSIVKRVLEERHEKIRPATRRAKDGEA